MSSDVAGKGWGEDSLDSWLSLVKSKKSVPNLIDYMFPNPKLRDEYLKSIQTRSKEEVLFLIKKFLIKSGEMGCDYPNYKNLIKLLRQDPKSFQYNLQFQYDQRLMSYFISLFRIIKFNISEEKKIGLAIKIIPPWEGITWILDIIQLEPMEAINVIDAYVLAHAQELPDGRLIGLDDASNLIRVKFINPPHSDKIIKELTPRDFEHLVEALYNKMGYKTELTPATRDGGKDVIAENINAGERMKIYIECKKYTGKVGIAIVQRLLGVVSRKQVTKGIIITTADFTAPAKVFLEDDRRLELIKQQELHLLLNKHFGPDWPTHLGYIISESKLRTSQVSKK